MQKFTVIFSALILFNISQAHADGPGDGGGEAGLIEYSFSSFDPNSGTIDQGGGSPDFGSPSSPGGDDSPDTGGPGSDPSAFG